MTNILRTIDLSKRFRKTVVLDHLNMIVPEHSVYGLVGPNGAGKTTTIKILMNARQPTEGIAEVFGRDSRRLSPEDFTQIGYVSENQQMPEWMTDHSIRVGTPHVRRTYCGSSNFPLIARSGICRTACA
jgi:ABC-2 type transport system ATP-binding protein